MSRDSTNCLTPLFTDGLAKEGYTKFNLRQMPGIEPGTSWLAVKRVSYTVLIFSLSVAMVIMVMITTFSVLFCSKSGNMSQTNDMIKDVKATRGPMPRRLFTKK